MPFGITEWEADEMRHEGGPTKTEQREALLREALIELKHARVFIGSREKMHPTGIGLYDELLEKIEQDLR